jgi:hypothetical protein
MTYQPATPAVAPPYPPAPGYGNTPAAPPHKQRRGGLIVGIAAAVLIAGLLGGGIGAFAATRTHQAAVPAADMHTQDIQLCTAYATINSALPKPQDTALELLPAVNGLRLAIAESPGASPEIRAAITDVIRNYDALIATFGKVRSRGLADPTPYDVAKAQHIIEAAWDACQLGS